LRNYPNLQKKDYAESFVNRRKEKRQGKEMARGGERGGDSIGERR
jgi:hypothetical protein